MLKRAFTSWAILVLVVSGLGWAQSQANTGVIEGVVTDDSGAVLPGATVTLLNTATNYSQVLITNESGRFRGVLLPLGPYRVSAQLEGFSTLVREGIELSIGRTVDLRMPLSISAVGEEIVVTDEVPLIETSRIESSVLIDQDTIQGIANNGRNFLELTKLTPGVAIVQGPDGDELTINGQKGIQNNISVDGADFNNPFFGEQRGGQRPAFMFNIDAIQEFVVVPDGAPAEFGRSSGGFVNVVTKSGSNAYKGSAHVFFKNDSLSTERRAGGRHARSPTSTPSRPRSASRSAGRSRRTGRSSSSPPTVQQGDKTKQNDPTRIEQRVVDALAGLGSPGENLPITRTDDAAVFLGKIDFQASDSQPLHRALHLHRLRAGQRHLRRRLLGPQRQRRREGQLQRDQRLADLDVGLERCSTSSASSGPARIGRGPTTGPRSPAPIGRSRTPRSTSAAPTASACRSSFRSIYDDTRIQLNDNVSWQKGEPQLQGRRRVQPDGRVPDLHRLRQRALHLQLHRRVPELRRGSRLRRVRRRRAPARATSARRARRHSARCCSTCSKPASAVSVSRRPAHRRSLRTSPRSSSRTTGSRAPTSRCSTACAGRSWTTRT